MENENLKNEEELIKKGRVKISHDKPLDLSDVELPDSIRVWQENEDHLPPVTINVALAAEEILNRNKSKNKIIVPKGE